MPKDRVALWMRVASNLFERPQPRSGPYWAGRSAPRNDPALARHSALCSGYSADRDRLAVTTGPSTLINFGCDARYRRHVTDIVNQSKIPEAEMQVALRMRQGRPVRDHRRCFPSIQNGGSPLRFAFRRLRGIRRRYRLCRHVRRCAGRRDLPGRGGARLGPFRQARRMLSEWAVMNPIEVDRFRNREWKFELR